jgi:hypothetical protein
MLAANRWREARKIFDAVGAGGHVDDIGFLYRLAVVHDLQFREFTVALA